MIFVDIHETEEFHKLGEVKDLGYDFAVIGGVKEYYIERKEISDFANSTFKKRIFYQIDRLINCCSDKENAYPILIIEGSPYKIFNRRRGKMSKSLFYGTISSIIEKGCGVIFTGSKNETKILLNILNKRADKTSNSRNIIKANKQTHTIDDEAFSIICSMKGIGEKTAEKIIQNYKTPKAFFNATKDELVELLGEKKGSHIYDVLNYEFE